MSDPFIDRPPPSVDPTVLTTQALQREIASIKEILIEKLATLDTKMDGHFLIDGERFTKIEERFNLIERQRLEQKSDTSTSIAAALEAQKETSFGLSSKVDDVKERVGRIESARQGMVDQRTEGRAVVTSSTAIMGTILAVAAIAFALYISHNTTRTPSNSQPTMTVTVPSSP